MSKVFFVSLQKFVSMKKYVIYLVKILIFMLVMFAAMRIVFIANYWHLVMMDMVPFVEIIRGFYKAIPLDTATSTIAGYDGISTL